MTAELAIPLPEGASASDLQTTPARLQQHHVVPHGWHEIPLGQIATLQRGFDLPHRLRSTGPYPVVTSSGFDDGHADFMVSGPGVVTGRYGTIGEVFYCGDNFWPLNTTLYVRDFHGNHIRFIYYFLQQIDYKTHSGKSGVPGVNRNDLHGLIYAYPPDVREQRAIAEALSDADALIEGLERLIAKKRLIKEGAMQELLSGARRLPGFSGEWQRRPIGQFLTVMHGKSQRGVEDVAGPYPILATGGKIGWARSFLCDKPAVLIGRKGTIDKPQYMDMPFWTIDTLFYSNVSEPNSAKFLYYKFCLIDWRQYNEASGVPSLNGRTIESIEIDAPEPDEQRAIAAVISDLESEIDTLEAKLAKARQIKQGMMQELLTGRIRLV